MRTTKLREIILDALDAGIPPKEDFIELYDRCNGTEQFDFPRYIKGVIEICALFMSMTSDYLYTEAEREQAFAMATTYEFGPKQLALAELADMPETEINAMELTQTLFHSVVHGYVNCFHKIERTKHE